MVMLPSRDYFEQHAGLPFQTQIKPPIVFVSALGASRRVLPIKVELKVLWQVDLSFIFVSIDYVNTKIGTKKFCLPSNPLLQVNQKFRSCS